MRVVAAYLLAVLGGNASPDAAAINSILSSVGIEAEAEKVEKLIAELSGKNLDELIEAGSEKLASLGGALGGAAPAGGAAAGGDAPAAAVEEEESSDDDDDDDSDFDF